MAVKKDTKGRNLKEGEDQLKDGRYRYRYTDKLGKRQAIYSWKLVSTDKTPAGKKDGLCLRQRVKQITRDLDDGIDIYNANITVNQLLEKYLSVKTKLANSTKNNYRHLIDKNIKGTFLGLTRVCDVKKSDILKYYAYLYNDRKFKVNTIQMYQNILFPAFQLAVDDNLIRLNPCKNCMKDYVQGSMSSSKKPLSREEQDVLLNFTKNDNMYSSYFVLMAFILSTGCRISEALGMTWDNVDFENNCVIVDHQVLYRKKNGRIQHYAAPPKNKEPRTIPLQSYITTILKRHKANTYFISQSSSFEVDGHRNFVFINSAYRIYTPNTIVRAFHSIRNTYNMEEEQNAHDENREPILLPTFTPHTLRHTFCTRMAENGLDIKVLQVIMGHKNISVTMQVYNHADFDRTQKAVEAIEPVLLKV